MAPAIDRQRRQAREAQFAADARDRFEAAVLYWYGPGYQLNWHHRVKARLLEAWARGQIDRLLLHEPPRHGKTLLASIHLPAWIFGHNPSAEMIVASHGDRYVQKLSRKTKRVINQPEYRLTFPETRIPEKGARSDRGDWRNTDSEWDIVEHGGHYECYGAGANISGAGGEFLIVEDPYPSRQKAESETYRQKINEWYDDDLYERREDDPKILIIHTRWHENDLSGKLQRDSEEVEENDDWLVYNMPGLKLEDDARIAHGTGDLDAEAILGDLDIPIEDPREVGEALWPEKRTAEEFEAARKSNARKFWSLIQQQPTPPGGTIFEHEWLAENRWSSLPTPHGDWFTVCDPKHGSKEPESSRAVVQLMFQPQGHEGEVYLVDQVAGIWSQTETEDVIRYVCGREVEGDRSDLPVLEEWRLNLWQRADAHLFEAEGDGPGIKSHLQGEIAGVHLVKPWAEKEQRARDVTTFWKAGDVKIPEDDRYDWVPGFVAEHESFPGANRDDQVDTSTYGVDHALGSRGDTDEDDDGSFYDGWFEDVFRPQG